MTPRNAPIRDASVSAPRGPVVTIYQNSDQVAGVLQQLFGQPLIVEESRDNSTSSGDEASISSDASVGGDAGVKIPLVGNLKVRAAGDLGASGSWTSSTGTAARQQFVYSQAYYLHLVRQQLLSDGRLTQLGAAEDASRVTPGDFIEFTTSFDPVELTLALEVITPELVDAIAQWAARKQWTNSYPTEGGYEAVRAHAEKMRVDIEAKGSFARAIATAVQADTRQGTTREYYGRIAHSPALTAITVCEREHFITQDPDRLLDGTFTVLGKVISGVEEDVPTFARNKLLRNLSADAFDRVFSQMRSTIAGGNEVAGLKPDEFLDLKLDSRVRGKSLRVLPLAIFS